jgi:hypothetical protein
LITLRQIVKDKNLIVAFGHQVLYQVCADEASATKHEDTHESPAPSLSP